MYSFPDLDFGRGIRMLIAVGIGLGVVIAIPLFLLGSWLLRHLSVAIHWVQ